MERFTKASAVAASPEAAYAWHGRDGALERLIPPFENARVVRRSGAIEAGAEAEVELKIGLGRTRWLARHGEFEPGKFFTDSQVGGPFRSWRHHHGFYPRSDGCCEMVDTVDYELPGGWIGGALAGDFVRRSLDRMFRYRHELVARDLEFSERHRSAPRLRVCVTGGYGFIGAKLRAFLSTQGHETLALSRSPRRPQDVSWNPDAGTIEQDKLEGLDAVIHLAGENVAAGRWTSRRKERIRSSRVDATRFLVDTFARLKRPPKAFLCGTAIGLYGNAGEAACDESTGRGSGFLAEVCAGWEAAAGAAESMVGRSVLLRTGMVIDASGGPLGKMLTPFKLGIGGPVGGGRQWQSWIAMEDWLHAVGFLLMNERASGPFNLTAPRPERQRDFALALGSVLNRPAKLPIPELALKLGLGEMAEEILLSGCRAQPHRLLEAGYRFAFPRLEDALRFTLGKREEGSQLKDCPAAG